MSAVRCDFDCDACRAAIREPEPGVLEPECPRCGHTVHVAKCPYDGLVLCGCEESIAREDGVREAARTYLDAEAEPAFSWVIESQAARREGRSNREVERMERLSRARVALEEALLAATSSRPAAPETTDG